MLSCRLKSNQVSYAAHIAPICLPQVGRDPEVFRLSLLFAPTGALNVMMRHHMFSIYTQLNATVSDQSLKIATTSSMQVRATHGTNKQTTQRNNDHILDVPMSSDVLVVPPLSWSPSSEPVMLSRKFKQLNIMIIIQPGTVAYAAGWGAIIPDDQLGPLAFLIPKAQKRPTVLQVLH